MQKTITVYVVLTDYESDEWDYPDGESYHYVGVKGTAEEARSFIENQALEEFYTYNYSEDSEWTDEDTKITMSHVAYTNGTGKHGTEISWYYEPYEITVEVP